MNRTDLSNKYLHAGMTVLEIGAYHNPFPANGTTVHYVDRLPRAELLARAQADPNLKNHDLSKIPETTFIGNGNTLDCVPEENRYDAVVNSHVLEHCDDPIGAIKEWVWRLNPNGVLIMAVPNKKHTFDRDRPITHNQDLSASHAYEISRQQRRNRMYREWKELVDPNAPAFDCGEDIHFNVWDAPALLDFLAYCRGYLGIFNIELFAEEGHEVFVVLRRRS